jgi:hypothetical protein
MRRGTMNALTILLKGAATVALIAASPILIIFAGPFAYGMAGDVVGLAGTAAPLATTAAICLGALAWVRWRPRDAAPTAPRQPAKSLG